MTVMELTSTSQEVGTPIAELLLTRVLDDQASSVFSPGVGRSVVHLREVELGTGRPDAILLSVSSQGLSARLRSDLRLPTMAHARVLGSIRSGKPTGFSRSHFRRLASSLADLGWLSGRGAVRSVPNLVDRSLVVEAKMSDWRTGVCQLSRARWAGHAAALLMPVETQHRVPRVTLEHNRIGLLAVSRSGAISAEVPAPEVDLQWWADLWLTELALRSTESVAT